MKFFILFLPSLLWGDFVSLEWLYLRGEQDGMAYAISPTEVMSLPTPWNSGFQVGLDLELVKKSIDILLEYTQYLTSCSAKKEGTDFFPTYNIANEFTNPFFGSVSNPEASWNMAMRLLNLEIGHEVKLMKKLTLRPHIGLGALWHHQILRINYSGSGMEQNLKRWGIGVRGGFNSNWILGYGFSLFADEAITAMWSRFRIKRADTNVLNVNTNWITIKPVIEASLGLAWEQGPFALRAGWNFFLFMENNQFLRLTEEANHGDLSLMGASLQVIWGF